VAERLEQRLLEREPDPEHRPRAQGTQDGAGHGDPGLTPCRGCRWPTLWAAEAPLQGYAIAFVGAQLTLTEFRNRDR